MNFFQAVKLAATIVPALFDLIPVIEKAYPLPKQGSEKLSLLLDLVRDAVNVSSDGFAWDDVVPLIQKWTSSIVAFMNRVGSFK